MRTARIIGTGSSVPDRIVTNEDLAGIVDTNDEWIRERTGIKRRRLSEKETTSRLAAEAAERAVENAGIPPEEIGLILVATSTADSLFPNTACLVQKEIGSRGAVCFDLNAACTGFLYALNAAEGMIAAGMCDTALVIGAENMSKVIDWSDRSTCILFGDGAGAAVIQAAETGWIGTDCGSDGSRGDVLTCPGRPLENFLTGSPEKESEYLKMDGQAVFKFAVKTVPASIQKLLDETGVSKEEIRYYVLHQANERIIAAAAKRLGEPLEKFPVNLSEYGNTSAASIPILLDEMNRAGKLSRGDKIVLAGFGAGLTWGTTLLTW